MRPFPDFLIIGVKRGGTQTLFQYLQRHPHVLPLWPGVENAKKTRFFDRHYARCAGWYRGRFPTAGQRRRAEDRLSGPVMTGEAGQYYIFHPLGAERVAASVPNVRILILLRNPVDRAWSHHQERTHSGAEQLTFEAALAAEPDRLDGEVERILSDPRYYSREHDDHSYLARGRYVEQLTRWYAHLDATQLHIIRSENLYADPQATMAQVFDFLGLPEHDVVPHHFNRSPEPSAVLSRDLRASLGAYYRPHVAELEQYLNRSFDWDL